MKETFLLVLKGFIIGIASIVPGVSGGVLAMMLGIYEKLISCASHIFKNFKENLKFLIPIGIGAVLSFVLLSNVIDYTLLHFPVATTLLFLGLILGGIPMLLQKVKGGTKKVSNWMIFSFTAMIVLLPIFFHIETSNVVLESGNLWGSFLLFLVGILAAATLVIPGVSGSFALMLIGYYEPLLHTVTEITHLKNLWSNILLLIPFGIGVVVGIILVAKLIEFLLKKYEVPTYFGIIGFVLASCVSVLYQMGSTQNVMEIFIGLILMTLGFMTSYKIGGE